MNHIAIVILNTKINEKVFHFYRGKVNTIICADGGANRLYDLDKSIIPQIVIGDMDSIRPEVRQYYAERQSQIIHETDQDTSDFEKTLLHIQKQVDHILVFGGLQERFDQTINSMHTLARFKVRGAMISDYSILRFFEQGKHTFRFSNLEQRKGISLYPAKGQARINTEGLRWNVTQEQPLQIGTFISTSNEAIADQVIMDSLDEFFFVTQLTDEYI